MSITTIQRLAEEHGVSTREHNGSLQVWEDCTVHGVNTSGWRNVPATERDMLAWLGY